MIEYQTILKNPKRLINNNRSSKIHRSNWTHWTMHQNPNYNYDRLTGYRKFWNQSNISFTSLYFPQSKLKPAINFDRNFFKKTKQTNLEFLQCNSFRCTSDADECVNCLLIRPRHLKSKLNCMKQKLSCWIHCSFGSICMCSGGCVLNVDRR